METFECPRCFSTHEKSECLPFSKGNTSGTWIECPLCKYRSSLKGRDTNRN